MKMYEHYIEVYVHNKRSSSTKYMHTCILHGTRSNEKKTKQLHSFTAPENSFMGLGSCLFLFKSSTYFTEGRTDLVKKLLNPRGPIASRGGPYQDV